MGFGFNREIVKDKGGMTKTILNYQLSQRPISRLLFSHFCKKLFAVLRNSVLKTRGNARKQQFHVAVYNGKWYHFVAWQIGITT